MTRSRNLLTSKPFAYYRTCGSQNDPPPKINSGGPRSSQAYNECRVSGRVTQGQRLAARTYDQEWPPIRPQRLLDLRTRKAFPILQAARPDQPVLGWRNEAQKPQTIESGAFCS